ncbi:energy-coupling factor transporter transmembrane component T family protein [Candidatus Latescibacterota bacterium]
MPILRDIALGRYVAIDSPLHRLDPRTKFVCTMVVMMATITTEHPLAIGFAATVVVALTALGRLPARLLLRNLRPFAWLFLFTFVLHGLMTPGRVLWHVPLLDLDLTVTGLRQGSLLSLRLAVVISAAALMTLTTAPMELTDGLERMLSPLRRLGFPAHELAMMVTIALRFIPVLAEEAERLYKAQAARGGDFTGGPLQRARKLVPLLVPLFISAFSRADRLALAMESRCYRGGEGRTSYRRLQLGWLDLAAALSTAGVAAGIAWLPRVMA